MLREVVGTVTHEFTYDFTGRPLSKKSSGGTFYYIYNARGDVTALVDSNGSIVNSYTYDVWGRVVSSSEGAYNPYRFASYRYDSETGLYYLRNRYYSPELMRFITRDAVRDEAGKPESSNYYQYANNDPVNAVDSYGLSANYYAIFNDWKYVVGRKNHKYNQLYTISIPGRYYGVVGDLWTQICYDNPFRKPFRNYLIRGMFLRAGLMHQSVWDVGLLSIPSYIMSLVYTLGVDRATDAFNRARICFWDAIYWEKEMGHFSWGRYHKR